MKSMTDGVGSDLISGVYTPLSTDAASCRLPSLQRVLCKLLYTRQQSHSQLSWKCLIC